MTQPGISPRILDTLRQLGLTEYGARCYVALLSLHAAEASAIAQAAEVPRTKVYAVLKDLVDSGWIVADGGRPITYRAAPPDERIAAAEKRIAQDASDATRELMALHAMRVEMVPVSLYLIRGHDAVLARAIELVDRARDELLVNVGFLLEGGGSPLVAALRKAARRGVTLRIGLAPGVDPRALGELAHGARVAVFPFQAIVCDSRQALVIPAPIEPLVALWNPTQALIEAIAPGLRAAWERAPAL